MARLRPGPTVTTEADSVPHLFHLTGPIVTASRSRWILQPVNAFLQCSARSRDDPCFPNVGSLPAFFRNPRCTRKRRCRGQRQRLTRRIARSAVRLIHTLTAESSPARPACRPARSSRFAGPAAPVERWKRPGAGGTLDRDASSVMHRSGCIGIAHDTGRAAAPHTCERRGQPHSR